MEFAQAFDQFEPDDYVQVSNGEPEPSVVRGPKWFMWRSHNFIGQLVSKQGAEPTRSMVFALPRESGASVQYTILEGVPHTFTQSTQELFDS